ncbi:unnamed protein product [Caenorhabditis sp. 36 PRJEB53466]|nr:unnamed protein product [Caenorhabditis sp. 36 PRJEB53466]
MAFVEIALVFFGVYILIRQSISYLTLYKCNLNPHFDIFGLRGLSWLNSSNAHKEFTKMCTVVGDKTFSLLRGATPVVVTNDVDVIHAISTEHFDCFHARIPEPFANDPVTSENIHMFAAKGERWKRLRTLTSYGLSMVKLKQLFPTIEKCVSEFLDHVNNLADGRTVTITHSHSLFQNHTSYVLARCAYGHKEKNHNQNYFLGTFMRAFGEFSEQNHTIAEKLSYFYPEIKLVFKGWSQLLTFGPNNKDRFMDYLLHLICKFKSRQLAENSIKVPDIDQYSFLGFFFEHHKEQKLVESGDGKIDMKKVKVEKSISFQEIAAQCKFIAVAGFDTTANTLALLFNFLAHNPDIQGDLYRAEIQDQKNADFDTINSLSFLQNCIFETLRLFPHASPLQTRLCTKSVVIGKYYFPENAEVVINPWGPHHDKDIWGEDTLCFRPSRFEKLTEQQKRAFMPFGVGPRQCVGMRFALLELKTTAFRLLQKYSVNTSSAIIDRHAKKVQMTVRDTGTIWPTNKLGLILKRRK